MNIHIILIPLFPLVAFVINILSGKRMPKPSAWISISGVFLSFLVSLFTFIQYVSIHEPIPLSLPWVKIKDINFPFGFVVDSLSAVMIMVVTTISLLIHIYSVGYMHGDKRYSRFFAYLSLFTASMLELVLADNLLSIFIGWELVGLCSYLLIGFWYEKESAANAGRKAFITTKIGDFGFYAGILLLFSLTNSVKFTEITEKITSLSPQLITISAILVFSGAVGKSAQFPLHVWLPDAMEGPTPVSALIHAATMVAAGVYLVARMFGVFIHSGIAMNVVTYIGTITAFIAASIALVTTDIKRVLAYSTISQLGYMMLGLGVGGYTAGMFHLTTHAFFKALLFLAAGSVIHGCHGLQNIFYMGGLSKKMKITSFTFLIASLSIAGIWPFSGFFSKDEILLSAYHSNKFVYIIATIVAMMTSFYMFRLYFLTFTGKERSKEAASAHESPYIMTIPLIILAFFSTILGFSLLKDNFFPNLVHFENTLHHEPNYQVIFISLSAALIGIFLAWIMYYKNLISASAIANKLKFVYTILYHKYYFDEIYEAIIINPVQKLTQILFKFDLKVIDGIFVDGTAYAVSFISKVKSMFDLYIIDGAVNGVAWITKKIGSIIRILHTGLVQNYILIIIAGLVIIILFQIM
jgi:NADH-quinone oxidoreductase subunit L